MDVRSLASRRLCTGAMQKLYPHVASVQCTSLMIMCFGFGIALQGLLFGSLALYEQTAPAAADAE
jgi:hypothetical protein